MICSSGVGCATIQPQQGTWTNERPKLVKLKKRKEKGERTMEVVVAKKPIEKVAHCNNDHTCNCC